MVFGVPFEDSFSGLLMVSVSGIRYPVDTEVLFVVWWEQGLSFPVASSPCIYLIFLLYPP